MKTGLFAGLSGKEIESLLGCLDGKMSEYAKGDYVLRQGDNLDHIAVLVKGKLHIQNDDYWGNRTIVNCINAGDMFGESYIAPQSGPIHNDVVAMEESAVIFFDVKRIVTTCPTACSFHSAVMHNLFYAISEKNRLLVQKIAHISKRSTREKLISYLSEEAKKHQSSCFSIPFNRQQLADFLSVDRSAMSNELCKMRDEGFLKFDKNNFELL